MARSGGSCRLCCETWTSPTTPSPARTEPWDHPQAPHWSQVPPRPQDPPCQPSTPTGSDQHPPAGTRHGGTSPAIMPPSTPGGAGTRAGTQWGHGGDTGPARGVFCNTEMYTWHRLYTAPWGGSGWCGWRGRLARGEATGGKRKAPAHDAIATGAGRTGTGMDTGTGGAGWHWVAQAGGRAHPAGLRRRQ